MEQFEKWDKKVKVKTWSGNTAERQERKWYREQTWRAALEWVRELPLQKDGPSKPKDLIKCIEEELGIESYD